MTTIDYRPSVTIGMPIRNRIDCIARVLVSIENLDYPKSKVKLVFVDAFSNDGTYEVLVDWKKKFQEYFYDVALIQEEANIPQARNICINNSYGDYILFWDSDVVPPQELLRQMLDAMETNKKIGIIGADYTYTFKNVFTEIIGQPLINKEASYTFMGFTLIRREVFNKIALFNESLYIGEDGELVMRLREETDYKSMWASQPVLHLKSPMPFRQIFKWCLYTGFYKRGEELAKSFSSLPFSLKLRLFYYGLLPALAFLEPLIIYCNYFIWGVTLLIAYLLMGTLVAILNTNIRKGIVQFFIYMPVNIATSYGVLMYSTKSFFMRLRNKETL